MKQLNEFEYLTGSGGAIEYSYEQDKKQIGSGQARGYLVKTGIWKELRQLQYDPELPLFSLADATIVTASDAGSYFGVDQETAEGQANLAGIAAFVSAGVMTQAQADEFLAMSKKTFYPYANVTLSQFNGAKGRVTYIPVPNAGRNSLIKITLNAPLDEKVSFSAYSRFKDCDYQNLGKHVHVQSNGHSYLIDLAGVQVRGDVFIRVPFPDFACEVSVV